MSNILNRFTKYGIYLLVFLVPLFFLPFSFEAFEYSKQYLLFFLASLISFACLAKQVFYDKELRIRKSILDYFVLGFLLIAVLSVVFSVDKISGLFGFYGRFSDGLVSLIALAMLYFLIVNNTDSYTENSEEKKAGKGAGRLVSVDGLLQAFLYSLSVIAVATYFSVFGIWEKLNALLPFNLPQLMLQETFNPVSGSLEGLSVFLAVSVVLLAGLAALKKSVFRIVLLGALVLLMAVIDFTPAWLILLVSSFVMVAASMVKRVFRENVNKLLIPISLVIISGILIPLSLFDNLELSQEQFLDQETSWQVGLQSATQGAKSGIIGTGLGTYYYDFTTQKPAEINQDWKWQIRFDRPGSHFAEVLGTMGFLGLLSYLALIGVFLFISLLLLTNKKMLPLFSAFLALVFAQFLYYQNMSLGFLFWTLMALSVVVWNGRVLKEKVYSFKSFPELSLVFSTVMIVLGIGLLALYFYGVKFYMADAQYAKALPKLGEKRVQFMEKAVKLNPYMPRYRMDLAKGYIYLTLQETAKASEERDTAKIQNLVSNAIDQAKTATTLQPNNVIVWETLGVVYREIRNIAQGALEWGVTSFEEAIKLEPTNPVLYTEMGKLQLSAGEIQKAKESFNKAVELKSNYADALIQQALLREQEGAALDDAINTIEQVVRGAPLNVEARFQLGRLYFNNDQVQEAITMFQDVIFLVPDHANAHYSLGVAYSYQGKTDKALEEFQKVLEINPGNQDVIQKIQNLENMEKQQEEEQQEEEPEPEEEQAE